MNKSSAGSTEQPFTSGLGGRRLLITLYATSVFLYWISLYLYVPTLPVYVQSKTTNLALVGIVLSMYGLWQAVVRLPLGIAADCLGWHKPFIVAGFVLAGLGAWTMGTAGDVNGLIAGRAITGLAAATWVPLVVVFSGLFPPEEAVRASALLTLVGSVGRMLATGTTGWLNELGGYSLSFFLATGAAASATLILLPAHEKRRSAQRPSLHETVRLIVRRDVLLPSLLSAVNQYANYAGTFGFVPILAKQLGASNITQSLLMAMSIGMVTLGNLMATSIVRRIGAKRLVYLSFLFISAGMGSAAFAHTLPMVFLAQLFIGLSQGVGYPVLMGMSIEHVADAERTTAMGLHQAVYAIGMFAGPWLSGMLADAIGIGPMFGLTAFACLVFGLVGTRRLVR